MENVVHKFKEILETDVVPHVQSFVEERHMRLKSDMIKLALTDIANLETKRTLFKSKKHLEMESRKETLRRLRIANAPNIKVVQDGSIFYIYFLSDYSSKYIVRAYRSGSIYTASYGLNELIIAFHNAWNAWKSSESRKKFYKILQKEVIPIDNDFLYLSRCTIRTQDRLSKLVNDENIVPLAVVRLCGYQLAGVLNQISQILPKSKFENSVYGNTHIYEHEAPEYINLHDVLYRLNDRHSENYWRNYGRMQAAWPIMSQTLEAKFDPSNFSVILQAPKAEMSSLSSEWDINLFNTLNYLSQENIWSYHDIFINAEIKQVPAGKVEVVSTNVAFHVKYNIPLEENLSEVFINLLEPIPLFTNTNDWSVVNAFCLNRIRLLSNLTLN